MASRPKQGEPRPAPRLYLVTPEISDAASFVAALTAALTGADVAAVLLRLAPSDEGTLIRRIKAIAPAVQEKGAALILDRLPALIARSRADGAHIEGFAAFPDAVETLKPDWIVGVGGIASRHEAMLAAEQGADYVMFGTPDAHGQRPSFAAIEERVAWWAEVFEVPCVAYAASPEEIAPFAAAGADFVAIGDWLWRDEGEIAPMLARATQALRLPETAA